MTSTVINAWNKAYAALDRFHYKQFGVSGALSDIASQISGISTNIQNASNEMHGLSGASQEAARTLGLAAREYRNLNHEERENEIARLQRIIESMSADRETVTALKRESENIIKKAVEMTFKTADKHASII